MTRTGGKWSRAAGAGIAFALLAGCAGVQKPGGSGWSCYTSRDPSSYVGQRGSACYREAARCQAEQRASTLGATACEPASEASCFGWVNGDGTSGWACYPDAKACAAFQDVQKRLLGAQKAMHDARTNTNWSNRSLWDKNKWSATECELWR